MVPMTTAHSHLECSILQWSCGHLHSHPECSVLECLMITVHAHLEYSDLQSSLWPLLLLILNVLLNVLWSLSTGLCMCVFIIKYLE